MYSTIIISLSLSIYIYFEIGTWGEACCCTPGEGKERKQREGVTDDGSGGMQFECRDRNIVNYAA